MDDIPSPDDIRKLKPKAEFDELTLNKWRKFTKNAIARCLFENSNALNEGRTLHFKFPVLRDMGNYKTIWEIHYPEMIEVMLRKGWWCVVDIEPPDIQLKIKFKNNQDFIE
jgi:hypothetical protein